MKYAIMVICLLCLVGCKSDAEIEADRVNLQLKQCQEYGLKPEIIWNDWAGRVVICK